MANLQNLRPFTEGQSHEEAVKNGSKGGIKSGEARRRRKQMKEVLNTLLNLPIKSDKMKEQIKELGFEDEDLSNQTALLLAMYNKAMKGDVQAFTAIRDTSGQKPVEVQEIIKPPVIQDDIK